MKAIALLLLLPFAAFAETPADRRVTQFYSMKLAECAAVYEAEADDLARLQKDNVTNHRPDKDLPNTIADYRNDAKRFMGLSINRTDEKTAQRYADFFAKRFHDRLEQEGGESLNYMVEYCRIEEYKTENIADIKDGSFTKHPLAKGLIDVHPHQR